MIRRSVARSVFLAASLGAALGAQVPPGWGVYSRFQVCPSVTPPVPPSSAAGLTLFFPLSNVSTCTGPTHLDIAGLTPPPPCTRGGWNCVLIDDADGSVITSRFTFSNGASMSIDHHVLSGGTTAPAIAATTSFNLGTAVLPGPFPYFAFAGVNQMAWLPGNRILFDHVNLSGPPGTPLPPSGVAILDLATGVIAPVPFTFPTPTCNAPNSPASFVINCLAASRDGRTAFLGMVQSGAGTPTPCNQIFSIPLPLPGTPGPFPAVVPTQLPLASAIGGSTMYQMAVDSTGRLVVSTNSGGLFLVDRTAPAPHPVTNINGVSQLNAMTLHPVTDEVFMLSVCIGCGTPTTLQSQSILPAVAPPVLVAGTPPQNGATGMAIRSSMRPFGDQASCVAAGDYRWQVAPNPGGHPLVGSAAFSLNWPAPPTAALSALAIGNAAAPAPVPLPLCMQLWLAPAAGVALVFGTGHPTHPLPLPANPLLCGQTFYFQSFHLGVTPTTTVYVSSPGLAVTLQ